MKRLVIRVDIYNGCVAYFRKAVNGTFDYTISVDGVTTLSEKGVPYQKVVRIIKADAWKVSKYFEEV